MVKRLGLVKLASKLDTKEKTVSFLRENGVLPRSVSCRKCGKTVETTGNAMSSSSLADHMSAKHK